MKKVFAIALVMALLCIISVGTTLSYFTDTDGAQNTMSVGQVWIVQNSPANNVPLFPYTGVITPGGELAAIYNAVDKNVTVTVNGNSQSAYIRTLFAFEEVNAGQNPVAAGIIHVNPSADGGEWKLVTTDPIDVNGVKYYIYSFTYSAVYASGATTPVSLKQVALDNKQDNRFYTKVKGEYSILVLSQAVQSQGFTSAASAFEAAFPISAADLATWFANIVTTPVTP